jgi:hypothetical protein
MPGLTLPGKITHWTGTLTSTASSSQYYAVIQEMRWLVTGDARLAQDSDGIVPWPRGSVHSR